MYNKENNTVRTPRVNSLFAAISYLSYISAENKNGQPTQIDQNSRWVASPGIEPGLRASETLVLSIVLQGLIMFDVFGLLNLILNVFE